MVQFISWMLSSQLEIIKQDKSMTTEKIIRMENNNDSHHILSAIVLVT